MLASGTGAFNFDRGSGVNSLIGSSAPSRGALLSARFGSSDLVGTDSFDPSTGVRSLSMSGPGTGSLSFDRTVDAGVMDRSYDTGPAQRSRGTGFAPDIRGFRGQGTYDPRLIYAETYPYSAYALPGQGGAFGYPNGGYAFAYPGAAGPIPAPATYYRGSLPPYYRERLGEPYGPQMPYARSPCARGPCASRYGPISEYPPASPECMAYMGCTSTGNPNDCRSCVTALGGPNHCAMQICGPNLY